MQAATDMLRTFPFLNSAFVERWVLRAATSPAAAFLRRRERARIRNLKSIQRVLVIADTNIGDSILLQPAVTTLAHHLPEVAVDYAFNRKMTELLAPDPRLNRALGVLHGGEDHHAENLDALRAAMADGNYDLVINFCPFFTTDELRRDGATVLSPVTLAIDLLRAYRAGEIAALPRHAAAYAERLITEIGRRDESTATDPAEPITSVFVASHQREEMARFLAGHGFGGGARVVMVNPDTSNASTFLGVRFHANLIRRLMVDNTVDGIILARAFKYRGVEREIVHQLEAAVVQSRVVMTPESLPLTDFAALVDCCSAYVGGDTGPLHIAAARKHCPLRRRPLRNRTVVAGVFKATDPRIYGYDTDRDDMVDSSQDAPATTFEARPPCKNLTCSVQRITATCAATACHTALLPEVVADSIVTALHTSTSDDQYRRRTLLPFPVGRSPELTEQHEGHAGESH